MRSESLGATGELHSSPDMKKAGSLYKAVILLSHTTALLREKLLGNRVGCYIYSTKRINAGQIIWC